MIAHHIVILMHDFPAGGTERVMIRLANAWASRGRRVSILCGDAAGPSLGRVSKEVAVRTVSPTIPRGRLSRLRLGRAVARALRGDSVDVIVAPGNFHIPVLGAMGRVAPPVVCKLSNPLSSRPRGRLATALFKRSLAFGARHVTRFVALSPGLARDAARLLPRGSITTIANPVTVACTADRHDRAPTATPRIVAAGRLVPQKRFDLALRALARPDLAGATLMIAGDGPERAALVALAAELGVTDRVSFAGHVGDIGPLLVEAEAVLLTSDYEGYPSVLVEALLAGVRVVSTDCSPAVAEIISHPSFGLIADATPRGLAVALRRIGLSPSVDPDARAALAEHHRPERVADAWLDLLDELVTSARPVRAIRRD